MGCSKGRKGRLLVQLMEGWFGSGWVMPAHRQQTTWGRGETAEAP